MRIDRLTLQNFNGFDFREFTFNPGFNLLVGENATGKTSVLDALSISIGSWFLGIRGYAKAPGIDADQVRVVAHPYQNDVYRFEKQFPSRIVTHGHVMDKDLVWTRELNSEGGRTTSSKSQGISKSAIETQQSVQAGQKITLPLICTYGTERLWFEATHRKNTQKEATKSERPSRLDGYRDCIDFTIQETSLLNWIGAEVSAGQQLGKETSAFRVAREAIVRCVEGATSLYYDERYKDLILDIKQYGHQMFKNLSDGQCIMLTLVGDLVRRATILNPHLDDRVLEKTPGVVTIDELDLHLHPKWQRHVIRDLKETFPAIQFITTTHSPQLIGESQPEEVILLSRQDASNPAQSYGMDSNWILKHVMGADELDHNIKKEKAEVERLIANSDLEAAQTKIAKLRSEIGDHPDLVRFSTRIDRFAKNVR